MNIKIRNEIHKKLYRLTRDSIIFGSEGSNDTDVLCLIPNNIQMDAPFHNRDHFLFYKDQEWRVDYLYTTFRCLINGLITGSSSLMYELMNENRFKHTSLEYFNKDTMKYFQTYKLGKCLVGIAQRDKKQALKLKGEEKEKKLKWVKYYTILLNDMLEDYIEGYQHDLGILRDLINNLPKQIDKKVMDVIIPYTVVSDSFSDLSEMNEIYFNSWRESL